MIKTVPFNQLGKAGYNRGINRAHVNRIKHEWCPEMKQPAIVSFRDGRYWIVDHQHQTQAEYELNNCDVNTLIECDVRTGLTYEQEAELYYRLNTAQKPLNFADKMIGLIEAKDESALKFRNVIESCGYMVGGNTSKSLKAISLAWSIFNKANGEEKLTDILNLTQECWPDNPSGVHSHIISGLLLFFRNHGEDFKRDHFIKVLSVSDPREIVRKSQTYYKQMDSKAFTQPYCAYSILINTYNIGLHSKLMPVPPFV